MLRINIQLFGGRGASSKTSGYSKSVSKYSYYVEGNAGDYQREANQVITALKSVLSDFGMEKELTGIYFSDDKRYEGSVNGFGKLSISKQYLANGNESSQGYMVNNSYAGLGTHEAGHLISNALLKNKVMPNATLYDRAVAYKNSKMEKAILKEAKRRFGSNPVISKYGSTSHAEKVAEAVSDVYSNGTKASAYSRQIVQVMKDINSGKYIPKIK